MAALQSRYGNGLAKLLQTEGEVKGMQEELEALQPQLVVSANNQLRVLVWTDKDII